MSIYERLPRGVRRLFRLPPSEHRMMNELDDEIRFHLDRLIGDLRARGLSEGDATTAALTRFGDTDDLRAYCGRMATRNERTRSLRAWMAELRRDVHFAARQIVRSPAVTATATLILALGIGANAAIFSIVNHLLLSPLPFADGNRMVMLMAMSGGGTMSVTPTSDMAASWQSRAREVEQVVIFEDVAFTLGDSSRGPTPQVAGVAIPPSAISFVGGRPLVGRTILASDTAFDAPPVVALSEGLWKREFGGASDIVGKAILLNGKSHRVIGVMPETFYIPFSDGSDVFVAIHAKNAVHRVAGIAKLRRGVTIDAANREMVQLFPPNSSVNSYSDPPRLFRQIDRIGHTRKQMVLLLFGAVGIVFLIACANVANLLLARSWSRQKEFAVRVALGAGRERIMRQVFTESLMLALLAGVLGVALSFGVLRGFRAALPADATDFDGVRIERAVLLWSAGISVLAGIAFGIAPAFAAAGHHVNESLKAGARTAVGSAGARRLRFGLVVGEVALSVVLLVGAGLLVRTLVALNQVDVGFPSHGLTAAYVRVGGTRFADLAVRRNVLNAILEGARAVPGVRGAIYTDSPPPDFGIALNGFEIEGRATPDDTLKTYGFNAVPPDYFSFIGLPLKRGRTFMPSADLSDKRLYDEFIINEALVRRFWPNGDAIGARIRRGTGDWGTIVGVVTDVRVPGAVRYNRDLQMYARMASAPTGAFLVLRTDLPASTLRPAVEKAVRDVDRSLKLTNWEITDVSIDASMANQRLVLKLLGAFAMLAVVLAAVGLHGVIAYSVGQRTREIGVRMALGAQSRDVAGLVLRQGLTLAGVGIVIGVAGAVAATRTLRTLLYGVQPGDPLTLGVVSVLLLVITAAAAYSPARRAARLDPVEALRAD